MDARHFLGLEDSDDPLRWRLPVTPAVSTPGRFLYGGCGLAAGIVALEEASGRPTVWATAQYLTYAAHGLGPRLGGGPARHRAQHHPGARRRAARRRGGADGERRPRPSGEGLSGTWVEAPRCPLPRMPPQEIPELFADTVLVPRRAPRRPGAAVQPARRPPRRRPLRVLGPRARQLEPSAATLAVIGDYVSGGVSQPLGVRTMGRSLDNTLRVGPLVPTTGCCATSTCTPWRTASATGSAHLWAEDGTLLATASQSISVRLWTGPCPPPPSRATGTAEEPPGGDDEDRRIGIARGVGRRPRLQQLRRAASTSSAAPKWCTAPSTPGSRCFDTADIYGGTLSEEFLGRALGAPRRRGRRGHQVRHGRRRRAARGRSPDYVRPRPRRQPASPGHRPRRPLPAPPARPRTPRSPTRWEPSTSGRRRARCARSAARTSRPPSYERPRPPPPRGPPAS